MRKSAGIAALAAAGLMAAGMAAPSRRSPVQQGHHFIEPSDLTGSVLEGAAECRLAQGGRVPLRHRRQRRDQGVVKHVGGLASPSSGI